MKTATALANTDDFGQLNLEKHYSNLSLNDRDRSELANPRLLHPVTNIPELRLDASEAPKATESAWITGRDWIKSVRNEMACFHRQMRNKFTRESARQQMDGVTKVHAECDARPNSVKIDSGSIPTTC